MESSRENIDPSTYRFWHEKKYRMSLIMIEIDNGEISICSNVIDFFKKKNFNII